jgi:hypothetical protein
MRTYQELTYMQELDEEGMVKADLEEETVS